MVVAQEELQERDYKIFSREGFAVPSMDGQSSWTWHTSTEHFNVGQPARFDLLFPKPIDLSASPEAQEVAGSIIVHSYVGPHSLSLSINGAQVSVMPQCTFELIRWSAYEKLLTLEVNALNRSNLDFARANVQRMHTGLKLAVDAQALQLLAELRPLDKPLDPHGAAAHIFDTLTPKDFALMLQAGDPGLVDSLVAALSARIPGQKTAELEATLKEARKASQTIQDSLKSDLRPLVLHVSPDQVYLQIFSITLANFLTVSGASIPSPVTLHFNELGFGQDYFVIRGYVTISQPKEAYVQKVYFLNIGIKSEQGVYLIKYFIPSWGSLEDIRNAQSMIHGFHILQ